MIILDEISKFKEDVALCHNPERIFSDRITVIKSSCVGKSEVIEFSYTLANQVRLTEEQVQILILQTGLTKEELLYRLNQLIIATKDAIFSIADKFQELTKQCEYVVDNKIYLNTSIKQEKCPGKSFIKSKHKRADRWK